MNDVTERLKERTMTFALAATTLCRTLTNTWEGRRVADQLFRASTSVGANHRAACRARTKREFIAKLGIVIEEADESVFWLEFAERSGLKGAKEVAELLAEGRELLKIFVASSRTASDNATRQR